MEVWKVIEGFEMYSISTYGRVKNNKSGKILSQKISKSGYWSIGLCQGNKRYFKRIHRLVAEAFIPNPENKPEVNHIDEDKNNNRVENLNWMTRYENIHHGTRTERAINSLTKFTPEEIKEHNKIFHRKYYEAHKEEVLRKNKAYYEEHLEEEKKRRREYYAANREKIRAQQNKYLRNRRNNA